MALVLGLNSDEVTEVLDFNFANFISEVDPGKYRTINENSGLGIGEDKSIHPYEKENVFGIQHDKQLNGKETEFKYRLDKNKTRVVGNPIKWAKRELAVSAIVKIFLDGVGSNIGQIARLINPKQDKHWYDKILNGFLGIFKKKGDTTATVGRIVLARSLQTVVLNLSLFAFLKWKAPVKVSPNIIAATLKDRGMFSGFQVREFFYDLLLFALTKDTYFQQQVIRDYNSKFNDKYHIDASIFDSVNGKDVQFKIGKREEFGFSKKAIEFCNNFQNITFRELYAILDVELAAAVSNYTTDSPLFFSDKFTPDFRVLEAVASSMSLPPALRAVFNESDVVFNMQTNGTAPLITPLEDDVKIAKELSVMVNGKPTIFVDRSTTGKIRFKKSDYER